jgi:lipoyl(octanoyl) transferase
VIDALKEIGIEGSRSKVNTGVWVGKNKICTVGVTASRWVTMHGLALNVLPDLKNFDQIIPCGVTDDGHGVCSVEGMKPNIKMDVVADALISSFSRNFDLEFENRSFSSLEGVMNDYPELSTAVIDRTI